MNPQRSTQKQTRERTITQRLITFLALLLLFSNSTLLAQDVLMGLNSNGGPEGKGTAFRINTSTKAFNVIKGFADWGANPASDLVRGTDGYLYGMTPNGGSFDHGTLFKISTTGDITILKHFNLYVDGGYPYGSLIQATDGNFYGMLNSGPNGTGGVIFKITPGGKFTPIRNFSNSADGGRPRGRLLQAADGHFYGLHSSGGAYGYGTIFRLTMGGTYSVLKSFQKTDGATPNGSLIQASDGALYGMAHGGGTYSYGVIFRMETNGTYKVVKHLNAATDAAYPDGNLIQAKDGMLYGMAPTGINYNGVAFKLKTDGTSFSIIHKMAPSIDGGNPYGSLIQGIDGYFYGLNSISGGSGYAGTAFKMNSSGTLSVIKRFTEATTGGGAWGSLIQAPDGTFYGMHNDGGKHAKGTIFKLAGTTLTVLAHLNGSTIGNEPQGNLAIGKDSAYFGVARYGGTYNWGSIYKICGGVTTVLKSFNRNVDGARPTGSLLRGKDGNLYGTAEEGGINGGGTIFRITPAGSFAVIKHLKGATEGQVPYGKLVQGADDYLYGTTNSGGINGGGTIFKITTSGGTFKVLRHLSYATDGSNMYSGLVIGKDANFYGMTGINTRFFKITKDGLFTAIKTISYSTDGGTPIGTMILGKDGNFYGTMSSGGTYSNGIVFRITPAGSITKLKHLNPASDGGKPKGNLVQGSDGAIYGTTSTGGTYNSGTIFKLSGTSLTTFAVLRQLKMETDGGTPLGGLILAPKITLVANAQTALTTSEDVAKAITLTGSGATGLTYNVLIKPRHGSVTAGTGAARTYTPAANFNGVDSFAFTTNLGCLASAPAWVKIKVSPVNDAPVLAVIPNKTVVKGTLLKFLITATDVDAGQTKTFTLVTKPTGAAITTAGTFSWTPSTTGTFTIKVRVTDNGSPVLYNEKSFTVTVTTATLTTMAVNSTEAVAKQSEEKTIRTKATLYPNPVTNRFTVTFGIPVQQVQVSIADMKGVVIYSKIQAVANQQLQVDATAFKPGAYFMQVHSAQGTEVLKFVKL